MTCTCSLLPEVGPCLRSKEVFVSGGHYRGTLEPLIVSEGGVLFYKGRRTTRGATVVYSLLNSYGRHNIGPER